MKTILLCVELVSCFLGAMAINVYYARRKTFFKDLCSFCERSKILIEFNHSKLLNITKDAKELAHKDFCQLLCNFELFLVRNLTKEDFCKLKNLEFLTKSERELVSNFFCKLGEMYEEQELQKISLNAKRFEEIKTSCENSFKKFSGLYFKLFIILGVLIVVLFV